MKIIESEKMINYRIILSILVFFFTTANIFAAGDEADELLYTVAKVMVVITLLSILLVLWLVLIYSEKNDNQGEMIKAPLRNFLNMLTKSTPVEKEHELLLDHDYDGIKELDSRIPPWFHGLLWLTVVFAIVYMIQYHVIGSGNVQAEEWLAEMEQAAIERTILTRSGALLSEETVTFADDVASLNSGKELYLKNCAACHGNGGEGLVGPNLTDQYWIHGGGIKNIFKAVKYGFPQKGMISWQTQMDPTQMQEVSSYVISMFGTNPPNAKAPEGEVWEEPKEETEETNI
jgi:cytochrome c oxidase cbb3-type subunit 3